MEYETIIIDEGEEIEIISQRYPLDIVSGSPFTDPNIAPVATRVQRRRHSGLIRIRRPVSDKSPRQHVTSGFRPGQTAKMRGDTDEFISAFWINGKPKCREGYRYDFRRKLCRRIK